MFLNVWDVCISINFGNGTENHYSKSLSSHTVNLISNKHDQIKFVVGKIYLYFLKTALIAISVEVGYYGAGESSNRGDIVFGDVGKKMVKIRPLETVKRHEKSHGGSIKIGMGPFL